MKPTKSNLFTARLWLGTVLRDAHLQSIADQIGSGIGRLKSISSCIRRPSAPCYATRRTTEQAEEDKIDNLRYHAACFEQIDRLVAVVCAWSGDGPCHIATVEDMCTLAWMLGHDPHPDMDHDRRETPYDRNSQWYGWLNRCVLRVYAQSRSPFFDTWEQYEEMALMLADRIAGLCKAIGMKITEPETPKQRKASRGKAEVAAILSGQPVAARPPVRAKRRKFDTDMEIIDKPPVVAEQRGAD